MDKNILKYVPKSKRHVIFDAYEDTIQELRYQIAGIKKEC